MTVFLTVFNVPSRIWLAKISDLTIFDVIARYVERMVSVGAATR